MTEPYTLYHGDCFDFLPTIPDGSVDLVLTDPPYNIGVKTKKNGKDIVNEWDRIGDGYVDWCIDWLSECARVLKPTGVLYFWHNEMNQIAELLEAIRRRTPLVFISFCIWDKGDAFRAQAWQNRRDDGDGALRMWFNVCEYCLHFFNCPDGGGPSGKTGLERILSNPACFAPLKSWYADEIARLGLTSKDIAKKYTEVTGRPPYMLRHYFQNSQFEIPTKAVYDSVYRVLGFRREYEDLRREYEDLRNFHRVDKWHCNVWHLPPLPSTDRLHTCQKPLKLLERLVKVSSPPGGVVLDPFMGSGSTGVAAMMTGRKFLGSELDPHFFEVSKRRISEAPRPPEHGEVVLVKPNDAQGYLTFGDAEGEA